ncbi:MAG: DHA2 family efflux MFS transporter permease subunit [Sphingobium sp.]|nr:DHA2 family efflux MFS transporter permease subunit [Sphingobium sp.]
MSGPSGAQADYPPLTGGTLALTAFALALGTFMQVLDTTIANVSLPTIAGNLGESADTGTWVVTSFAVANGIAVPLTGWLMGRFGVVRTFVASVVLFTLASVLCGIAWNLTSLIVFRVFQGSVSGPMIPGSQALLISIFPPQKRATALGVWSITMLVAPVGGPILGGIISDNYHWSWIFLINAPVGLFCALICWKALRHRETPTRNLPIDKVGVGMLILWVGTLQIMLDLGKNADWFNSTQIVLLGLVALVGFLAWLIWELTDAHPAVNLSLFKRRNFAVGTVIACLGFGIFFSNLLLMPLWLQTQMGYTATWAGYVAAPSGIAAVLCTPIMARLTGKVDVRWIASFCFLCFALSFYLRSEFTTQSSFWVLIIPQIINGVGMSGFFLSVLTIQLDGLKSHEVPAATGLSNFARITCGSFGASIITTAWDRREALHQSRLADHMTRDSMAYQGAIETFGQLGGNAAQAAAALTRQMVQQAYLLAIDDLAWLSSGITLGLIALVWITRRPAPMSGPIAVD